MVIESGGGLSSSCRISPSALNLAPPIPRTARSEKVAAVQEAFASQPGGDRVEIVGIDDIIGGDFTKALEGGCERRTHVRWY